MPQEEIFIPWNEGATMLDLKRSAFFYLVESGQVRAQEGRKKRDGRYNLQDILAIKEKRAMTTPRKPYRKRLAPVMLDWLSPLDIPAILRLDQIVYDEMFLAEAAVYRQWSEKNPQLAMAAFDARSDRQEMLAYVAALPLDESVILQVMRGEREEIDITQDEIQTYERPGAYTLLANSAVTHPDRPDLLYKILYRMMDAWVERFPERYVTRAYAQSVSERGDRMIQHFFMQPRYDLAPDAYMLDLARPGASKVIRRFQERLAHKGPRPEELQRPYVPAIVPITHTQRPSRVTEAPAPEGLPDGWVLLDTLIKQYHIGKDERKRIIRAMDKEGLLHRRNVGGYPPKIALDPQEQAEFLRRYVVS
jgi:hypothetical protein